MHDSHCKTVSICFVYGDLSIFVEQSLKSLKNWTSLCRGTCGTVWVSSAAEASQSPVDEMPPSPTGHHDAMGTGHRLLKQISAYDTRLYYTSIYCFHLFPAKFHSWGLEDDEKVLQNCPILRKCLGVDRRSLQPVGGFWSPLCLEPSNPSNIKLLQTATVRRVRPMMTSPRPASTADTTWSWVAASSAWESDRRSLGSGKKWKDESL